MRSSARGRRSASPRKEAPASSTERAKPSGIEVMQQNVGNRATRELLQGTAPPIVHDVLRGSGQPLERSVRAGLEPQLGRELGDVRVHTDERAAASAQAVGADAYTVGRDIVFDRGHFAPETTAGRSLLVHELTHVTQQDTVHGAGQPLRIAAPDAPAELAAARAELTGAQPVHATTGGAVLHRKESPAARKAREEAEAVSRDYTDAQTYLTDFYQTALEVHHALMSATHRAIGKFSEISKIQDSRLAANITYNLVRVVLGVLPGAKGVIELFDALAKGASLAMNGSRLATIAFTTMQRTAAGVYGASAPGIGDERRAVVKALDTLSALDTDGAQAILAERDANRGYLDQVGKMPGYRKGVLEVARDALGPKPQFSATDIRRYEAEYEYGLYREHYLRHAWINHRPPSMAGNVYTSYSIQEVPEAAQKRILELHRSLGHVAQVAIDTRFSSRDPDYAEVVKILLDWGIPLYWLRGYVTDTPEKLHTGNDLQMPYRGARFGEVK